MIKSTFSAIAVAGTAAIAVLGAVNAAAQAQPPGAAQIVATPVATPPLPAPVACNGPAEYSHFARPLFHTMSRLIGGLPLTIVAIGSSSTAGAGASSPEASYPSRLAVALRQHFPGHEINVLNRGANGEETDDMMARFRRDVIDAHPQLVLWQVGTNSVLRDHPLRPHSVLLHEGVDELKSTGADIVLIDPQYSPVVIAKSETPGMVEQIAAAAKEEDVDLFQRFALMRDWYEKQHLGFDVFVSPDRLHMNDWGYACWAKFMATAIAEAATRPVASAAMHNR
jgi:acyl-CoA thioesterase I